MLPSAGHRALSGVDTSCSGGRRLNSVAFSHHSALFPRYAALGTSGQSPRHLPSTHTPRAVATEVEQDVPPPKPTPGSVAGDWFFTETGQKSWIEAMQLNELTPELPSLLREMGANYDPDRLSASLSARPAELTARSVRVATALGGFLTSLALDYASGTMEANYPRRARELLHVLTSLGPAFIKIGQALSSRPDLLPKPYLDTLSDLQDRLPSFPTPVARAVIEEELGVAVDDIFSYFSPEPVAAASLGQVYRGVLRADGSEVAIKVQRPGISEAIAIDMVLLRRLMAAVDDHVPIIQTPIVPLVDEFAARLFAELDYRQEGRNAERFGELYAHVPRVAVPSIEWSATARRVLTMEWIEGVKLTDTVAMEAAGLDVVDFVTIGVECTLRQLLEAGFFHADPHPGNLLATRQGNLVYLDFGLMAEAPPAARYAIIAHVVHLVNRDYLAMCMDYYTLDFIDPGVDTTPIAPALAEFFDPILANSSVARLNFKSLVDGLGGVLFQYPFKVPAYYALILRCLTVLEGLALGADPEYNLLGAAYPYMARRLLTDPAPQLRASFEDMVLKDGRLRWSRIENLWREGSRSADYDPNQLWLLAEWVCSEGGRPVRRPLASEAARLIDAVAASVARRQVSSRAGEAAAAALVPATREERRLRWRAAILWQAATGNAEAPADVLGPLSSPADAFAVVNRLRDALSDSGPKVQSLLMRPGAQELLIDIQLGLAQRVAARGVRLLAGLGQLSNGGDADRSSATAN